MNNRHVLYGALAGGPCLGKRQRLQKTTVPITWPTKSRWTTTPAALARWPACIRNMAAHRWQTSPSRKRRTTRYFVEASINSQSTTYTEIRALLNNRSSFPGPGLQQARRSGITWILSRVVCGGLYPIGRVTLKINYI